MSRPDYSQAYSILLPCKLFIKQNKAKGIVSFSFLSVENEVFFCNLMIKQEFLLGLVMSCYVLLSKIRLGKVCFEY